MQQRDVAHVDLLLQVLDQAGQVDAVVEVRHVEAVRLGHVRQVLVEPLAVVGREEVAALVKGRGVFHLERHVLVGRHLVRGREVRRLRARVLRVGLGAAHPTLLSGLLARAALLLQRGLALALARRTLLEGLARQRGQPCHLSLQVVPVPLTPVVLFHLLLGGKDCPRCSVAGEGAALGFVRLDHLDGAVRRAGEHVVDALSVFLTDALGVSESGCVDVLKRW